MSSNCCSLVGYICPERGGVIDVLKGDVIALDEIEGHRLRLKGFQNFGCGEFDH